MDIENARQKAENLREQIIYHMTDIIIKTHPKSTTMNMICF